MNKLDMKMENIIDNKITQIKEFMPDIFVETDEGIKIDFDLFKQNFCDYIVENDKEKYQLTWPGKKKSISISNIPSKNTLRPQIEKSINYDTTENVYIEGDNLDVLKILQESYLKKIKCIYIDPPYNTGNDFIYNDDFSKDERTELLESGVIDEYGNKLISNNSSNGRFHSDWLSMIYPRLKLARNLLSDDGVIFISINDNELNNLKKICDEIFGESNFIAQLSWYKGYGKNESHFYSNNMEYILIYSKNYDVINSNENNFFYIKKDGFNETMNLLEKCRNDNKTIEETQNIIKSFYKEKGYKGISAYCNVDENYDLWRGVSMEKPKDPCYFYDIIHPITNMPCKKPKKGWRMPESTMNEYLKNNLIVFGSDENSIPNRKYFLKDMKYETPKNFIEDFSQGGTDILNLFDGESVFDYPKSISVMNKILEPALINCKECYVMDFFSGSATTAETIIRMNNEDGGNRKFILIQMPEKCKENSIPYKLGYKTICDIALDRIKKVFEKTANVRDEGFRVYKVDSSNMKDIYYKPSELKQTQLHLFETNVKEERTNTDLLTQVILDLGLTLDLSIKEKKILNNIVYFVDNNALVACFDDNIDINIIDVICQYKPLKVVFKDSSFKLDSDKINLTEKIKKLSFDTEIDIL